MDLKEVVGKVSSNVESGVREQIKFEMRKLYSIKVYEMVGIEMKCGVGEHCRNVDSGVRELTEFETRELYSSKVYEVRRMMGIEMEYEVGEQGTTELELWRRWYRASPRGHHP
jgi:hypothetical protein